MSRVSWAEDEAVSRFSLRLTVLVAALLGWFALLSAWGVALAVPEGVFADGVRAVWEVEGAFLLALALSDPLCPERERTPVRLALGFGLFPALAVLAAPLCGLFPPAVAFLCRMTCPESFYYMGAGVPGEGKATSLAGGSIRLRFMAALSCVLVGVVAFAMLVGGFEVLRGRGLEGFGWLLLVLPALLVAALVALTRGRTHAPGRVQRVAFLVYHGFELLFWTSFWLAAVGWCLAAGA